MKNMKRKMGKILKVIKGDQRGQFAVDIALGLAVVIIISAFIVLPELKNLSATMMGDLKHWWSETLKTKIFLVS